MADTEEEDVVVAVPETKKVEEPQKPEGEVDTTKSEGEDGEVTVQIGEETPSSEEDQAPEWVRDLRKSHRESQRRLRELEQENQRLKAPAEKPKLGPRPKLEDFDFDADKFADALESWHAQKREQDERDRQLKAEEENQLKAAQSKMEAYGKAKADLKVANYQDAEESVQASLNPIQQAILLQHAKNPALVVYALGNNPGKLKDLASLTDPMEFGLAMRELELQLKVTPRKAPPPPDKNVSGAARSSGGVDTTLERLEAEAEKTGDRSKVIAYKRKLREKQ
jgi:hypothetical protein